MKTKLTLIVILLVLIVFGAGMTYAIFFDAALSNTTNELATFLVDAQLTDQIDIPLEGLKPGDNLDYDFQIVNSSDVNINYYLTIKTMHFIPFDITLVNESGEELLICDESHERNLHNELECKTSEFFMNYNSFNSDKYTIKLNFSDKYNTLEYSSLVDYIVIEVDSYQKID